MGAPPWPPLFGQPAPYLKSGGQRAAATEGRPYRSLLCARYPLQVPLVITHRGVMLVRLLLSDEDSRNLFGISYHNVEARAEWMFT